MLVGVTGSIACGKSEFCNILRDLGYLVIDCDEISHNVIKNGRVAYYEVLYEFGENILNNDKEINRKKLGKIVFNDYDKKKKLENIIHPKVIKEIKKYKKEPLVFFEVPLLFESNMENLFDKIICVGASFNNQVKRLMLRDGYTQSEAMDRILSQILVKEKMDRSDYKVYNDKTIVELRKEAIDIVNDIKKEVIDSNQ